LLRQMMSALGLGASAAAAAAAAAFSFLVLERVMVSERRCVVLIV
jgi:homoserine kinase